MAYLGELWQLSDFSELFTMISYYSTDVKLLDMEWNLNFYTNQASAVKDCDLKLPTYP